MAYNHPHHKHGHEQHEKPTDRLRQGPIGMVMKERSNIAMSCVLARRVRDLLVLAVIAYLIFN